MVTSILIDLTFLEVSCRRGKSSPISFEIFPDSFSLLFVINENLLTALTLSDTVQKIKYLPDEHYFFAIKIVIHEWKIDANQEFLYSHSLRL